jgi:hypothetical protein
MMELARADRTQTELVIGSSPLPKVSGTNYGFSTTKLYSTKDGLIASKKQELLLFLYAWVVVEWLRHIGIAV